MTGAVAGASKKKDSAMAGKTAKKSSSRKTQAERTAISDQLMFEAAIVLIIVTDGLFAVLSNLLGI